jgi:hypothetical protein
MAENPSEPTNLVLEHLRVMLAEANAMRAEINARFDKIEADVSDVKRSIRGFERNTIAEVYKANLTVASFVDHERRIEALERKLP